MNRTVIADSAVAGRYHVFTRKMDDLENMTAYGYSIYENRGIQTSQSEKIPPEAESTIPSLIDLYERVRHLARFDPNHCPILEVQTVGNDHVLLQYHRARDFNPALFTLDREVENGEIEAIWVRGITPEDGLVLKTNIRWGEATEQLPEEEEGAIDIHYNFVFSQLMVLKRRLQIEREQSMQSISLNAQDNHLSKVKLFKPEISVVLSRKDAGPIVESIRPEDMGMDFRVAHPVMIRIISDGRKAYLEFINQ